MIPYKKAAAFDNQINVFLTKFCREEEGLSCFLSELYHAYLQVASSLLPPSGENPYETRSMGMESFKKRVRAAGIRSTLAANPRVPYSTKYTVFLGLDLDQPAFLFFLQRKKEAHDSVADRLFEDRVRSAKKPLSAPSPLEIPGRVDAPLPQAENSKETGSSQASAIEINGTTYDSRLIATMKKIRGFVHAARKQEMTHIVTFHNPQLGHQFVTTEDARRILKEWNG